MSDKAKRERAAQEFVRALRSQDIPSEGYQHRGARTWDEGIAAALVELLKRREQIAVDIYKRRQARGGK